MKAIVFDAVNEPLRLAELPAFKPARAKGRPMECEDLLMLGQANDHCKVLITP